MEESRIGQIEGIILASASGSEEVHEKSQSG